MTLHDLTQALEDTAALVDVATQAGVSTAEAKRVCAALAGLPVVQTIRICTTAQTDKARQRARDQRRGR